MKPNKNKIVNYYSHNNNKNESKIFPKNVISVLYNEAKEYSQQQKTINKEVTPLAKLF